MLIINTTMRISLGSVCLYAPSLSQRYNILTDTPKSAAKSFGL